MSPPIGDVCAENEGGTENMRHSPGRYIVPQLMWGDGPPAQRRAGLSSFARMLIQYVFETGPSHRRSLRIDEEFGRADITSYREPGPQVSGRFFPKWQASLLAAFPSDEQVRYPLKT